MDEKLRREISERAAQTLERGLKCIINTDIDGILSGLFLRHYLGMDVIGFCDSKDNVWIQPGLGNGEIEQALYVDIYVAPADLRCIDQHLVACDKKHLVSIAGNPRKLNPHFFRPRYADPDKRNPEAYAWKYPFGTCHFIMACLEAMGFRVAPFPAVATALPAGVTVLDLVLRADDAGRTTQTNYPGNAKAWWQWLVSLSGNSPGQAMAALSKYAMDLQQGIPSSNHAEKCHTALEQLFTRSYSCRTADANFSNMLRTMSPTAGALLGKLVNDVANWVALTPFSVANTYTARPGGRFMTASSAPMGNPAVCSILARPDLFSYAFTYCMGRSASRGFSYTLWPPHGRP